MFLQPLLTDMIPIGLAWLQDTDIAPAAFIDASGIKSDLPPVDGGREGDNVMGHGVSGDTSQVVPSMQAAAERSANWMKSHWRDTMYWLRALGLNTTIAAPINRSARTIQITNMIFIGDSFGSFMSFLSDFVCPQFPSRLGKHLPDIGRDSRPNGYGGLPCLWYTDRESISRKLLSEHRRLGLVNASPLGCIAP